MSDSKLMTAFGVNWRCVWEETAESDEGIQDAYLRLFAEPQPSLKEADTEEWDDSTAYHLGRRLRLLEPSGRSLWVLV